MKNLINAEKLPRIFSGSVLKLIAVVAMFIDHAAFILLSDMAWATTPFSVLGKSVTVYWIARKIGRLAFPIFCFLITEGWAHTRNRKRYGLLLLVFAILSEIPFDLAASDKWFSLRSQNVYFTLLLGVLLMAVLEQAQTAFQKVGCSIGVFLIAWFLRADYGLNGVLLIGLLYILREKRIWRTLFAYPFLSGGLAAWCAFAPIELYSGERGFIKSKVCKYAFYAFYPLHMLVLVLLKQIL